MARSRQQDSTPQTDARSAQAPGVRTEPEVIADAKAALDERAAAAAAPGTADPALLDADSPVPAEVDESKTAWYVRGSDGYVAGVDAGSPEHGILDRDAAWKPCTRSAAVKAAKA
jgi:hypothetical protein